MAPQLHMKRLRADLHSLAHFSHRLCRCWNSPNAMQRAAGTDRTDGTGCWCRAAVSIDTPPAPRVAAPSDAGAAICGWLLPHSHAAVSSGESIRSGSLSRTTGMKLVCTHSNSLALNAAAVAAFLCWPDREPANAADWTAFETYWITSTTNVVRNCASVLALTCCR